MNKIFTSLSISGKMAVSALIFLIIAGGVIYFIIVPAVNNVAMIKIQTDNQMLQTETNYAQGQSINKLKNNLKIIEPQIGELEQAFSQKSDTLSFITSLESATTQNNVTEKASLGDETALNQSYSEIPLQLEVRGNFSGTMGFIASLEKLKNYININTLEITAIGSESSANGSASGSAENLVTEISAMTYWEN